MKMRRMNQKILSKMLHNAEISTEKKKLIVAFLVFVILVLSLGITRQTLGIFSRSFVVADSAMAAKFDVIITTPTEFESEQGESNFEYHFLSDIDIQGFVFQVTNNGGADILCKPYINSDITYRIYVEGEAVTGFHVAANETVSFWLLIAPDGLDTNVRHAKLLIDIQQMEGR